MEIYLVRHTKPHINKGVCYGQSDIDLADTMLNEFKIVSAKIPIDKTLKIYSSPLKRCVLLAKTLADTISTDNRLKELNFGDWELKPWNTISQDELTPWMTDFVNTPVPQGESYLDLNQRVLDCFNAIKAKNTSTDTIIIVTHAGPIRAILANITHTSLKDSFNIKVNYGDVFHLAVKEGKTQLLTSI